MGVIAVAAIGVLLVTRICLQMTRRDTLEDYTFLCANLFGDLPVDGTPTLKLSDAEVQVRVSEVENRLAHISWRDRNLALISRNHSLLIQQAETLQRNAPRLSPILFGSAQAALGMYTGQRGVVGEGGQKALNGAQDLVNAISAFQKLLGDKRVVAIQLADLAPQFSGQVTNAQILTGSFAEHTPGFLEIKTKDAVTMTNSSGQDLHNCVVAVRLSNSAGESYLNLYFVPDWKNGEKRTAQYSSMDFPKDTVDGIVRVDLAAWSKECSMEPLTLKKPTGAWPALQ